jgi:cytochrome P450
MTLAPEPVVSSVGREATLDVLGLVGHPTALDGSTGAVLVLTYDEVNHLARDPRLLGIGLTLFDLVGVPAGELRRWYGSLMFTNDGPTHDRLRRLVSKAFTPSSVERLRDGAAADAAASTAALAAAGGGDLVAAYDGLPLRTMARLLGIPVEVLPDLRRWVDALSPVFGVMEPAQVAAAADAIVDLRAAVDTIVIARRGDPADDVITALLAAEDTGDTLTHDEVIDMVTNLLVGGHDTTAGQIGCSLFAMSMHPQLGRALHGGSASLESVVSETIRSEPSIGVVPRVATTDVEIGGRNRAAGTFVLLSSIAANHDPAAWAAPDEVRPDRFDHAGTPRLITFGSGPHYCLGANLARMTLAEVVRSVAPLDHTLTVDPADVEWVTVLGTGPASLPVTLR